jgi:ketosteroid isomerase-like protein
MRDENIKTIQVLYEAFGRGDVARILDELTDDVERATDAQLEAAPWHHRYVGRDKVPAFFESLAKTIDVTEFTPLSFTANDTDVMCVIRFGMTMKATGKSSTAHIHHWWRFRDGKIYYYRGAEDTALTQQLLTG